MKDVEIQKERRRQETKTGKERKWEGKGKEEARKEGEEGGKQGNKGCEEEEGKEEAW